MKTVAEMIASCLLGARSTGGSADDMIAASERRQRARRVSDRSMSECAADVIVAEHRRQAAYIARAGKAEW